MNKKKLQAEAYDLQLNKDASLLLHIYATYVLSVLVLYKDLREVHTICIYQYMS